MIPYSKHYIDDEDITAVINSLKSHNLTQGPLVDEFENNFAKYVGSKYAVAVSNGTAALHLAYLAAGVDSSNCVLTSPITFAATANAALYCGGKVLFADIDKNTINISPESLNSYLSQHKNIRVVAPVHFAGLPCDIEAIKNYVDKYKNVVIIEDASHALGAHFSNGMKVGCCNNSLMTTFSFHPVKSITTGEGGMITTNDENIYRKLLRLRGHGINKLNDVLIFPNEEKTLNFKNLWYYEMQELGYNYRISDIQCALGISQLKKIDKFIKARKEIAGIYEDKFKFFKFCNPAQMNFSGFSSHHLFVLRINFEKVEITRAELMTALRERDILTQVHYIPVVLHPFYRKLGFDLSNYPNAKKYYSEALSIPIFYGLEKAQQNYVIEEFKRLIN